MNILYVSGSPRKNSNTDILIEISLSITGGQIIKLSNYTIKPCISCWKCLEVDSCVLHDDMTDQIIPMLLDCDGLVLGSPVYFNNVSSLIKAFMDRTWSLKNKLRNKIGGAIVVGRGFGSEGAMAAINAFFLKHEIIPVNRGVTGCAYEAGAVAYCEDAKDAAKNLGCRINEIGSLLKR